MMEQETKKPNKPMFWAGVAMLVITAIVYLTVEKDLGAVPIIMGIVGIVSIATSGYRPMK